MTLGPRGIMLLALVPLAGPAHGIEDAIAGRTLAMRQGKARARLVLVAHTAVVAPLPGSGEDPTLRGASLEIGNPRTGEWAQLAAPASGWTMNALGTVFRFRAAARGAAPGIRSLVIRHARRLKVKASAVGITLDEPAQGVVAAALTTGTRRYCMVFGGEVRRDEPGKFAARNAPPPTACPEPDTGAIATTTTTTTSSTIRRPGAPATTSTTGSGGLPSTSSTTVPPTSTTRPPGASSSTSSTSSSTSSTQSSTSSTAPVPTTTTSSSTSTTKPKKGKGPKK